MVNIIGESERSKLGKSKISVSDMSQVVLFQTVSKSSSIVSPIMKDNKPGEAVNYHTLFVHYMKQTHQMVFHLLNVLPNTTNSQFIQHGYKDIKFSTKIHCETFQFTRVSFCRR